VVDGDHSLRLVLEEIDNVAGRYGWGPVSPPLTGHGEADEEHAGHLWLGFYATSMVAARALSAAGVPQDVVLGHSGGEVSALVVAGCMTVAEGAQVLCERARAVEGAGLGPGTMVVLEAPAGRVAQLCGAIDAGSVTVAVDNSPRQVVVSGAVPAVSLLERAAELLGIATTRLRIPDAYHNPRLGAAARRFAEVVSDVRLHAPLVPLYSPQMERYLQDADDVRALLKGLLVLPVRFRQALTTLHGEGVDTFIECGAKQVLGDVVPQCLPSSARAVPLLTGRTQARSFKDLAESLAHGADRPAQPKATAMPARLLPEATAPAPPAVLSAEPAQKAKGRGLPEEPVLRDAVRAVYAELLEYPADVVEDDMELENELGVSSLKQTQAVTRLLDIYDLPTPGPEITVYGYRTVAEVASLLRKLGAARA